MFERHQSRSRMLSKLINSKNCNETINEFETEQKEQIKKLPVIEKSFSYFNSSSTKSQGKPINILDDTIPD